MDAAALVRVAEAPSIYHHPTGALASWALGAVKTIQPYGWVVVVDVNGIHELNHRIGWSAVDLRLKAAHVRTSDLVIRLGGDEYCVPVKTMAEANRIAERLSDAYASVGLSAMMEVAPYMGDNIASVVQGCLDEIMSRKNHRDTSFISRLRKAWRVLLTGETR